MKHTLQRLTMVLCTLILNISGNAQNLGDIDTTFRTGSRINGTMTHVAVAADGKTYIAGNFTGHDGEARNRIARLHDDGSLDGSFDAQAGPNNAISKIVPLQNGKLFILGTFTSVNGVQRNRIALLDHDGTLNQSFNPGTGPNDAVLGLEVLDDGKILIVGNFTEYAGVQRSRIARLHSSGTLDSSLNPGTGANFTIRCMAVQANGRIIIGGSFTNYNGVARNRIAELNSDGSLNTQAFNSTSGSIGTIHAITLHDDDTFLVGGSISYYNGMYYRGIVRMSRSGNIYGWGEAISSLSGEPFEVQSIIRAPDGRIYIHGSFDAVPGYAHTYRVKRLHANGTTDHSFATGYSLGGPVTSIALSNQGALLLAGSFGNYSGKYSNGNSFMSQISNLARLLDDGRPDEFYAIGTGPTRAVNAIIPMEDGRYLVGGNMQFFAGLPTARKLVMLDSNGGLDTRFETGSLRSGAVDEGSWRGTVNSIFREDSQNVLIGRSSWYGSDDGMGLTRLNSNGALLKHFSYIDIRTVAIDSNRAIFVADYQSIARIMTGSLDYDLAIWGNIGDFQVLKLQPDGRMLVGGNFTTLTGVPRNRIARLNPDFTLDETFDPGTGANSTVHSIATLPDGKILLAGSFTSFDGVSRGRIARLNPDGSLDQSFDPGLGANHFVRSITLQVDGKILIGGFFTSYNGITRNRIARLHADGSIDLSFDPGTAVGIGGINSILLQPDGKAVLGGAFRGYGGEPIDCLVRIFYEPYDEILSIHDYDHVFWARTGSAPEVDRVTFDQSTDGIEWTFLGEGTRAAGGWELGDINLVGTGTVRVRSRIISGMHNGSSYPIEQTAPYSFSVEIGFKSWPVLDHFPPDKRGPLDRNGPMQLQNLLAYAMGLNPLAATAANLPNVGNHDTEAGTVAFRYRRATDTPGTTLKPMVSQTLTDWQDVDTTNLSILETHDDWEQVELTLPAPPDGRLFLRLEAQLNP